MGFDHKKGSLGDKRVSLCCDLKPIIDIPFKDVAPYNSNGEEQGSTLGTNGCTRSVVQSLDQLAHQNGRFSDGLSI